MFVKMGYTAKKMAKHFKCSAQLVYKRLYEEGIYMRGQYKQIRDNELDAAVKELNDNHPNTGATVKTYSLNLTQTICICVTALAPGIKLTCISILKKINNPTLYGVWETCQI